MATGYVGYEIDLSDLEALLDEVEGELRLEDNELARIGARAAFMIKRRTAKGIDYAGDPFERYSESYADFRAEHGRNVSPVDLLFEGNMLAALQNFVEGGEAVVGFASGAEARKASWHNEGTKRMPRRRFLDFLEDGDEEQTLAEMAAKFMAERIGRLT